MLDVRPFLWFPGTAREALVHYAEVFADAEVVRVVPTDPETGAAVAFSVGALRLGSVEVLLFNGDDSCAFTHAFSLMVQCDTQAEIDRYWDGLLDGGRALACGWLEDQFGVAWQITPRRLLEMLDADDAEAAQRARSAMLDMVKLDLPALEAAFAGDDAD